MISTIIFDLGGIVAPEAGMQIQTGIADYLGISKEKLGELILPLKGKLTCGIISLRDAYAQVIAQAGISRNAEDVLARHIDIYTPLQAQMDKNILELVEKLKQAYTVVCLTNTELEIADYNKANTGIFDIFHKAFISTDMGMKKPDRNIYDAVIKELGCRPADAIFIDDNPDYIQGARQAGIDSILYGGFEQLTQKLISYGVHF